MWFFCYLYLTDRLGNYLELLISADTNIIPPLLIICSTTFRSPQSPATVDRSNAIVMKTRLCLLLK